MRAPVGRRKWPISGPRFRRKPATIYAAETPENAPPDSNDPPSFDVLTGSRNVDFRIPPTLLAEIGRVVGGSTLKSGPPRAGAIGQFPAPAFAGKFLGNAKRIRQKTRRRNPINPAHSTFWRDPEIPTSGFPQQCRRES